MKKAFFNKGILKRIIAIFVINTFIISSFLPSSNAQTPLNLLAPSALPLGISYTPAMLRGIAIDSSNPFSLNFIIDQADCPEEKMSQETQKLIKYFLASLTIPEKDLWVNLSPTESSRIIATDLGQTDMGRDLLLQDYVLKQLSSMLMHPDNDLGKKFWDQIYIEAKKRYGTTDIPINTFNRVWIIPQNAVVYEFGNKAFVAKSKLKVLMENEYLAMKNNKMETSKQNSSDDFSSPIVKEIIVPAIEREVNEGKNFAELRQIYDALILAKWYKNRLKKSIITQTYADQNKINGINLNDQMIPQKIYDQYIQTFKNGAFDFIKEEYNAQTQEIIERKFISGGLLLTGNVQSQLGDEAMAGEVNKEFKGIPTEFNITIEPITQKDETPKDFAMNSSKSPNDLYAEIRKSISVYGDFDTAKGFLDQLIQLAKTDPSVNETLQKALVTYANGLSRQIFSIYNNFETAKIFLNRLILLVNENKSNELQEIVKKALVDYANKLSAEMKKQINIHQDFNTAQILLNQLKQLAQINPVINEILQKAFVIYANGLSAEMKKQINIYKDFWTAKNLLNQLIRLVNANKSDELREIVKEALITYANGLSGEMTKKINIYGDSTTAGELLNQLTEMGKTFKDPRMEEILQKAFNTYATGLYKEIKSYYNIDDFTTAEYLLKEFIKFADAHPSQEIKDILAQAKALFEQNRQRSSSDNTYWQRREERRQQPPRSDSDSRVEQAYQILGLPNGKPLNEVTLAWREFVKKYYPSVNAGDQAAEEKMKVINTAYNVLKAYLIVDNAMLNDVVTENYSPSSLLDRKSAPGGVDFSETTIQIEGAGEIPIAQPLFSNDPASIIGFKFEIGHSQTISNLGTYLSPALISPLK